MESASHVRSLSDTACHGYGMRGETSRLWPPDSHSIRYSLERRMATVPSEIVTTSSMNGNGGNVVLEPAIRRPALNVATNGRPEDKTAMVSALAPPSCVATTRVDSAQTIGPT